VEIFDNEFEFFVVSGVNDTAEPWSAVLMTPLGTGQRCKKTDPDVGFRTGSDLTSGSASGSGSGNGSGTRSDAEPDPI
jgi:hypothetical protein